ncbi:MAG: SDR family NAD(P)-dependent oxidoreductase [Sphingomonas sp.]|jgi:3-hydroxyacyl-CoA dehydrogenase/3a,7a,12a-trihydroxy-5b-cholest-24-enoyl-CoA hydratase|uniref:SDR family NAD(P)-dependent oxidoreductase n=1 Tax=Sphingomonas sp. TaxID=28214 RepID=UPI0035644361
MGARRLDGRIVLITGAGGGLGRSYARYIAGLGAHVVVNDLGVAMDGTGRSPIPAEEAVAEIVAAGGSASADASDVTSPEESAALITRLIAEHGRIDALINNAGNFLPPKPFTETTLAEFERVWRSHCGGTYNLCRAVLPHMQAADAGRIVNTCSTQGLYGAAPSAAYASAKAAVQGLTLSIAAAVRGTGIAANCLSPGAFTRMVDATERPPDYTEALRRNLSPDLVAPVAAWLCHPDCADNGAIVQAFAGWISYARIGDLDGFWDFAPSIDSVAAGLATLPANGPITGAADTASHAAAIIARAETRRPRC